MLGTMHYPLYPCAPSCPCAHTSMRGEQAGVWRRLGGHAVRINRLPHYVSSTLIPSYAPPHTTTQPSARVRRLCLIEPQQPMAQTRPRRVSLKKFPGCGYECSAYGASFSSLKNGGAHVAICGAPSAPTGATTPSSAASHVSEVEGTALGGTALMVSTLQSDIVAGLCIASRAHDPLGRPWVVWW